MKTASYNYDVEKFFTKWLSDMATDQCEDGSIPHVIPACGTGSGSAAWDDAATICPWQIYLTYGNPAILRQQFDCMKNMSLHHRCHEGTNTCGRAETIMRTGLDWTLRWEAIRALPGRTSSPPPFTPTPPRWW